MLTMRYRKKNRFFQMMAKLNHLFVMAGWTEPTTSTTESKKILVVTIRTTNPCKSLLKIPAV